MTKNLILAIVVGLAVLLTGATLVLAAKTVTVKGSDTMVILNQRWAEVYMKSHAGKTVQVNGGGSGVGIAALINGTTDVCAASRPMKSGEKKQLRDRYATTGNEIPVAKDGLSIYLNKSNPVTTLSLDQLKGIYTGKITNWKELGGNDARILLYGRENSSGTYVFFKDNVLGGADFAPNTQTLPGTAAVVNAVAKDANGIGYGGVAYAKDIRYAKVSKTSGGAAYEPTQENVATGAYPISRELYFYTANAPKGEVKDFIDWVLGPEGQALVTQVGYFPIK